ncbi:MAG: hypothetical protein H0S84_03070 [Bacteroidales bacterium]|nr:hypothetical protein [Bacteroidales bacterium]
MFHTEYYYYPNNQNTLERTNALSFGFDIETVGHVFQLHFSNAQAMFERAYITKNASEWRKDDINFLFCHFQNLCVEKNGWISLMYQ